MSAVKIASWVRLAAPSFRGAAILVVGVLASL
jgi:hypothetical protein